MGWRKAWVVACWRHNLDDELGLPPCDIHPTKKGALKACRECKRDFGGTCWQRLEDTSVKELHDEPAPRAVRSTTQDP